MGGFGSGRDEYATTPDVEECRHLAVDEIKAVTEQPGFRGSVWWGDPADPDASITVEAVGERTLGEEETRAARLRLIYTITDGYTDESEDLEYSVPLEYTACNFGGYRPWFQCPGLVDGEPCARRAGKLYLPLYARGARYYLCRECYDLGYRSSRDSGNDLARAEQRYRKAFAKADAENRRPHPNNAPHVPERTPGMHYETFEALVDEVQQARREWHAAMDAQMRALSVKYDYDWPDKPVL